MFQLDSKGNYQLTRWAEYPWLEHGFGTRISGQWTAASETATLKQIHSDIHVVVREGGGVLGEGDALLTDRAGTFVAIRTADCIPLLFADPVHRAVAAVHAGWRGTAAGIAAKTVGQMAEAFGSQPEDLEVSIGPGIGACCYEVGPEVAAQFGMTGHVSLDLTEFNRLQLRAAGVCAENIFAGTPCTFCSPDLLHSFRRDRELSGRMVSAIRVR
jgi:YfiH family protein